MHFCSRLIPTQRVVGWNPAQIKSPFCLQFEMLRDDSSSILLFSEKRIP